MRNEVTRNRDWVVIFSLHDQNMGTLGIWQSQGLFLAGQYEQMLPLQSHKLFERVHDHASDMH